MLFHTSLFAVFFIVVYCAYLLADIVGGKRKLRIQNIILLCASYGFYASWDWRFLSLLVFSTVTDFVCARRMFFSCCPKARKSYLLISVLLNIGLLGVFKYAGFFVLNFQALLNLFGLDVSIHTLNVILPLGISFYTFQSMSYTIDVYRGQLKPVSRFIDFALYVSFFPQLIAGPIERATRFLPQITSARKLQMRQIYEGCHLFFLGLFMKVVIGDSLGFVADRVFAVREGFSAGQVMLGTYAFTFQIYADFAGYTHMARGLAKLFGFELMLNFRNPYLSVNPREFWRRWHISLSTWLRDYLYIPLGGNRKGKLKTYRNLVVTMLIGGLWHGAAWHFVLWGLFYGLLLSAYRFFLPLLSRVRKTIESRGVWPTRIWFMICLVCFFQFTVLGRVLFRVETTGQLVAMFKALGRGGGFYAVFGDFIGMLKYIVPILIIDVIQYRKDDDMALMKLWPPLRWLFYLIGFYLILFSGIYNENAFIYFQF